VIHLGSLARLCLVSHQLLPPARRLLYFEPFIEAHSAGGVTWQKAWSLLASLEGNDGELGKLVRNISRINRWMYDLSLLGGSSSRELHKKMAASWYCSVLRACPNLQNITLTYSTDAELTEVIRALGLPLPSRIDTSISPPSSHLALAQTLIFFPDFAPDKPGIDLSIFFTALRHSSISSLDQVTYYNVNKKDVAFSRRTTSRFPLPVNSLHIHDDPASLSQIFPLVPETSSSLEHFQYEGRTIASDDDLIALSKLVGLNLQSLLLVFYDKRPRLSPDAFLSYPLLSSLHLRGTHGPSLALLKTLVKSSPQLVDIAFTNSNWICNYNPKSEDPDEIFPEAQIVRILKQFPRLQRIHLGNLPTSDPFRYEALEIDLLEAEIQAGYKIDDGSNRGSDEEGSDEEGSDEEDSDEETDEEGSDEEQGSDSESSGEEEET